MADAAAGKIPGQIILVLLAYKILSTLPKILPIILMLAVLLTFFHMARDKELMVLATTGVNKLFYTKITLYIAVVYASLTALICFYFSPLAEQQIGHIKEKARQQATTANIVPGRFKEIGLKEGIFYVERRSSDKTTMKHAFLHSQHNGKLNIIKSDKVRLIQEPNSGDRFVELQQGRHYMGRPGMLDYRITEFATYAILIEHGTTKEIHDEDFLRRLWRAETPVYQAEFHWRLGLVIACILLALFSLMLHQFMMAGRGLLAAAAILVYLIYSNLLSIGTTLIKRELIPAAIGLWWAHALLLAVIILLYYLPDMQRRKKKVDRLQILAK